jgi:serine protease Do
VAGADQVVVETQDGREFEAFDIRTDPQSDLAVLRIKSERPFEFARLGDSDKLQIGDWVLAIGNPFEFESSVSAGIISAKGRSLGAAQRATFLQTDAAINPGNSGGPLVNLRGEVVGINTAIASRTGAFNGIGFAIPINQAKWVSQQLAQGGTVSRAWLGVGIRQLSSQIRQAINVKDDVTGVLVGEVRLGAPSDKAGIQVGDIITQVSGQPVYTSPELQRMVEQTPLGQSIQIRVLRDGKPTSLTVRAAALPETEPAPALPRVQGRIHAPDLGVNLYELTSDVANRLNLRFAEGGLLVTAASQEAKMLGLVPGSVIYRVGNMEVQSADDLEKALDSQAKADVWKLFVEIPEVSHRMILFPTGN